MGVGGRVVGGGGGGGGGGMGVMGGSSVTNFCGGGVAIAQTIRNNLRNVSTK